MAATMGDLGLKEEEDAGTSTTATATRKGEEEGGANEEDLEEEKHNFFFDGAPDGLKCSVGFCLMTEAVLAMTSSPISGLRWRATSRIVPPRGCP